MRAPAVLLLVTALTADENHQVVPGKRLGKIEIGMLASDVRAAQGQPREYTRSDRLSEWLWKGAKGRAVRALLAAGRVVQIFATSSAFRGPDGISTADDPAVVVKRGLRRSSFSGRQGGFGFYYDDVERGIAWMVNRDLSPGENAKKRPFRIYAVIVHAPGRPVIMDDRLRREDDEDLEHTPADACVPERPANCE